MADPSPSDAAKTFLSAFFGLGRGSSLVSHPPHKTLDQHREAVDECIASGLITKRDFNRLGSVEINATDEGHRIAQEALRAKMTEIFNG